MSEFSALTTPSPLPNAGPATVSTSTRSFSNLSPALVELHSDLLSQVSRVFAGKELTISHQRLYKTVEWLCIARKGSHLTSEIYSKIDEFIEVNSNWVLSIDLKTRSEGFVQLYDQLNQKCLVLGRIYMFLDQTYLLHHPFKRKINIYWKEKLYSLFHDELIALVLETLTNNKMEFTPLFLKIQAIFQSVDCKQLHNKVLEHSIQFYKQKHRLLMMGPDRSLIFQDMQRFLATEIELWQETDLFSLIKNHAIEIVLFDNIEVDFPLYISPMFSSKRFTDLHILFQIIKDRQDSQERLGSFSRIWRKYVEEYISQVIQSSEDLDVVSNAFKAKTHFNVLVKSHFLADEDLEYGLRQAFILALSQPATSGKVNKNLVLFTDKFFKTLDLDKEKDNKETLKDIQGLFNSIEKKDTFYDDYKRILSRRLLQKTTKSKTLELELIDLFQFSEEKSMKLKKLFNDLEVSTRLSEEFQKVHSEGSLRFEQLVLSDNDWPHESNRIDLLKPLKTQNTGLNDLHDLRLKYQQFYSTLKPGYEHHIFKYDTAKGKITVSYQFDSGIKQLTMTENMALVLLLFNTHDELSREEIKQIASLTTDSKTIESILYSLSQSTHQILIKIDGKYQINQSFNSSKKSIEIKYVPVRTGNKATPEPIHMESSRSFEDDSELKQKIQAFIVRELKHSSMMLHSELIIKILGKYPRCTNAFIKPNIEYLLDREFIKREGNDKYVYIP